MAITLGTAARNAACNGVVKLADSSGTPGLLTIRDATGKKLCDIRLSLPAFSEAVQGTAVAAGLPLSGTAVAQGSPARYDVTDGEGVIAWSGTIPGGMTLDSDTVSPSQIVRIERWTHTQPGS